MIIFYPIKQVIYCEVK